MNRTSLTRRFNLEQTVHKGILSSWPEKHEWAHQRDCVNHAAFLRWTCWRASATCSRLSASPSQSSSAAATCLPSLRNTCNRYAVHHYTQCRQCQRHAVHHYIQCRRLLRYCSNRTGLIHAADTGRADGHASHYAPRWWLTADLLFAAAETAKQETRHSDAPDKQVSQLQQ